MNRLQSKTHRIGTYEINKISLSWFSDKIYILNNGYDGLALVISVNYKRKKKNSYLNNYSKTVLKKTVENIFIFFSSQNSFFVNL